MKLHITHYEDLVITYGREQVVAFMNAFELTLDHTNYDLSYTTTEWWDYYGDPANRKVDVRVAWDRFVAVREPLHTAYENWAGKYRWLFAAWDLKNKLRSQLPQLHAKLTKPLDEYAHKPGWRNPELQNKNAEAVRLTELRIKEAEYKIWQYLQFADQPPTANQAIAEAWEYYQAIVELNPSSKVEKKVVVYTPLQQVIKRVMSRDELLRVLREFPYTSTDQRRKPEYNVAVNGVVLYTHMLVDWLRATPEDSTLEFVPTDNALLEIAVLVKNRVFAVANFRTNGRKTENTIILEG